MKVKSITQLTKEGFSRHELLCIANSKNSPAFKTAGGGKWLFDIDKLDKFLSERR